jgi:hypothetical protein
MIWTTGGIALRTCQSVVAFPHWFASFRFAWPSLRALRCRILIQLVPRGNGRRILIPVLAVDKFV